MDFVVVDVETANPDLSSICQIGIASFQNSRLADTWVSLVNPRTVFSSTNVSIHGIFPYHVEKAPAWCEIYPEVSSRLSGTIVVSHTPFDRVALERACICNDLPLCEYQWIDSAAVVRSAWPELAHSGFGLPNIAKILEIEYQAHDALEDARCAGQVFLRAIEQTGIQLEQWLSIAGHQCRSGIEWRGRTAKVRTVFPPPLKRFGNPEGKLFGEVVVFTGELSIARDQAASLAAGAGCHVDDGVTKRTTLLVVGDQDISRLAGHDKSSKQRKAEVLISKGHQIQILTETDFKHLLDWASLSVTD